MTNIEEAKKIILKSTLTKIETETLKFSDSYGRVLSKGIISRINVPQTDNSSMDGYALVSSDTAGSSSDRPVFLDIVDEIKAGENKSLEPLVNGKAIRIMTGAHIPTGADAVIAFEDTEEIEKRVKIFKPVAPAENIRFAGEDISAGDIILERGTRIESVHIGLIASINNTEVSVYKKPAISIISTGDELVEPGSDNINGKTLNSNAYVLMNEVKKTGGDPEYFGIVKDNFEEIKKTIQQAMTGDMIICTGGVSMGRYDFIPDVLKSLGAEIFFHKVAIRPGKPILFARIQNTLFFGLPGNPVSVMVSFIEFVLPAILKMSGSCLFEKPVVKAILKEKIYKEPGRRHFIRGIFTVVDGTFSVSTTGGQGSGILNSMAAANCLIILPEDVDVAEENSIVDIKLIKHGEISV